MTITTQSLCSTFSSGKAYNKGPVYVVRVDSLLPKNGRNGFTWLLCTMSGKTVGTKSMNASLHEMNLDKGYIGNARTVYEWCQCKHT